MVMSVIFLSFSLLRLTFRGDREFLEVFIITFEHGFYYCSVCFLLESQECSLASL